MSNTEYKLRLVNPINCLTVHKSKSLDKAVTKCYDDMINLTHKYFNTFIIQNMNGGSLHTITVSSKQFGGNNELDILSMGNEANETVREELDILQKKQDDEKTREELIGYQLASINQQLRKPVKINNQIDNLPSTISYDINPYIVNLQRLHSYESNKSNQLCSIL